MAHLLKETLEILKNYGKTPADVRWVGVPENKWLPVLRAAGANLKPADPMPFGTWDDFTRFANIEYDDGYGGNEIEGNLVIVGDDWWLERGEYDGSEWWEFKSLPVPPAERTPLRATDLTERS